MLTLGFLMAMHTNADTLAIWVCYDTLALISHMPMINLQFTGNMSVCFIEFAKVLRLDFIPVADWIEDWTDVG